MEPFPAGRPSQEPSQVEGALRAHEHPRASDAFRSRLRKLFLHSGARDSESRPTAGARRAGVRNSDLESLLVNALGAPAAGEGFRAQLKGDFLGKTAGALPVVSSTPRSGGSKGPRISLGGKLYRLGILAAAAAALVAVTFFLPREPRWEVLEITLQTGGSGETLPGVSESGHTLGEADTARADLERLLDRGERLANVHGTLELDLGGWLRMRVASGSDIEFPEPLTMGTTDSMTFVLHQGEIFLETLAHYPGNPIQIRTPDAWVNVFGTALGVLVDSSGTCTCVDHGEVWVEALAERGDAAAHSNARFETTGGRENENPMAKVTDRSTLQIPRNESIAAKSVGFGEMSDPKDLMHTEALVDFVAGR